MIKLTLRESANSHIYINAFQIVCFYAGSKSSKGSIIEVVKGDDILVEETPEEIQKLIEEVI